MKTDLATYNNSWYRPGSFFKRICWYVINELVLRNPFVTFSSVKVMVLKAFGARLGKNVVIKPRVNIKYPWKLQVGNNCWIGENVWIDNLGLVIIGDNVCLSQGAMLICGNHDYKKRTFDLIVGSITINEGAWIGAKAIVGPNTTVGSHAVLSLGSVASKNLEAYGIYRGNPAVKVKQRIIE